jgi:phosphoglycolate phosphatase
MKCNICGNEKFLDMGSRKSVRCSQCFSLERTRLLALFLKRYKLVSKSTRVLHIAPEMGLAKYLHAIAGDNCAFVDLNPQTIPFLPNVIKLDLCSGLEKIPSESYDLIIHSHVLEHLPCNYTSVLYHLHRILSTSGRILCSIPFVPGFFDSCTSPDLGDDEKIRRFGQNDHCRKFGISDLQMSLGKVYKLEEDYDVTRYFSAAELEECNIPEEVRRGYSPSSVLCLGKEDYLLK